MKRKRTEWLVFKPHSMRLCRSRFIKWENAQLKDTAVTVNHLPQIRNKQARAAMHTMFKTWLQRLELRIALENLGKI